MGKYDALYAESEALAPSPKAASKYAGLYEATSPEVTAEAPRPTLGQRIGNTLHGIKETFVGGAKAAGEVLSDAKNVPGNLVEAVKDPMRFVHGDFAEPAARRRQLERGVDDMVTLGHGQKLAARIGNAAGDAPDVALGPETFNGTAVANTQEADAAAAPEFRQLGNVLGVATPGATASLAEGGAKIAGKVIKGAGTAAKVGRSVAGYELSAPAQVGLSAGAEGHRLESTIDAATDPVNLALATVPHVVPAAKAAAEKIAAKSEKGYAKRTNEAIFKNARPKDYDPASQVQRANPEQFQELIHSPEFKPVRQAAMKGNTEVALDRAEALLNKVSSKRLDNYAEAVGNGYKATPGAVVDRMEKVAAYKKASGHADEAKYIRDGAQTLRDEFSTVDVNGIREGDTAHDQSIAKLKPYLPDRPTLTKAEFQDAAVEMAKTSGGKNYGDVPTDVHQAIESLPFRYDPEASIDLVHLRRAATRAQNTTRATLGSIAETEHFRIVKAVDDAINDGLDAHLDGAAATSPKARAAVERIRHDNKIISMSIAMRDALEMRAKRENMVKGDGNFMKQATKAVHGLHIAGAVAAPFVGGPAAPLLAIPTALYGGYKAKNLASDAIARRSYARGGTPPAPTTLPPVVANAPATIGQGLTRIGAQADVDQRAPQSSDDLLSQLVQRADSGDANAVQKLSALTRNPIVSARVSALRRRLAPNLQ